MLSKKDFFEYMENHFTWSPFFKLTNLCDNFCAHCCERSGPDCEPKFIEQSDIEFILKQFKYIKNNENNVTITGGEPMTAYTAKTNYYIPQILKCCGKNGYNVHINTNARWALSDKAQRIYTDFDEFVKKYKKKLVFHLSLDKFHKQSVDANSEFLNWAVKNDTSTEIYMFYDDLDIVFQMLYKLKDVFNIEISDPILINSSYSIHKFRGTNKMFCMMPYQGITNMGRAKDNKIATKQPFLKTDIYFSPLMGKENEICFDNNGYAMLSANDNDTVKTEYRDKNGKIKPIAIIKQELFTIAYQYICMENQI